MRTRGAGNRVDSNQRVIVDALRRVGALVLSLASIGMGAPDVLVCFRGRLTLMEIKRPNGKLGPEQVEFQMLGWPVRVVRTVADALNAIGAGV